MSEEKSTENSGGKSEKIKIAAIVLLFGSAAGIFLWEPIAQMFGSSSGGPVQAVPQTIMVPPPVTVPVEAPLPDRILTPQLAESVRKVAETSILRSNLEKQRLNAAVEKAKSEAQLAALEVAARKQELEAKAAKTDSKSAGSGSVLPGMPISAPSSMPLVNELASGTATTINRAPAAPAAPRMTFMGDDYVVVSYDGEMLQLAPGESRGGLTLVSMNTIRLSAQLKSNKGKTYSLTLSTAAERKMPVEVSPDSHDKTLDQTIDGPASMDPSIPVPTSTKS